MAERLHALVLEVVPVEVVEHFVEQFSEHIVVVPDLDEGFQEVFARD